MAPKKILVVEDDPGARKLAVATIEELDHNVEIAESGKEAMERLEKGDYDLAVLDIVMPPPNGIAVYQWIKKNRPDLKVLFTSTISSVACDEIKGAPFVKKPYRPKDLASGVSRTLKGLSLLAA